jgi:dihydropteroate synthase
VPLVAAAGAPLVIMHWRAPSRVMNHYATYDDVVADVCRELLAQADRALAAGVQPDSVLIDPGLGFAKNAEHNWALMRSLSEVVGLGFPVLIGASRKRFLPPTGETPGSAADLAGRDLATAVLTYEAARTKAWGVRVHDVKGSVRAAEVAFRLDCPPALGRSEAPSGVIDG